MENKQEVIDGLNRLINEINQKLSIPLATSNDPNSVVKLKEQLSEAQSFAIRVVNATKEMDQILYSEKARALRELSDDELYKKSIADNKKILLDEKIANARATRKYLESAAEIVKERCTTAQSLLKASNVEGASRQTPPSFAATIEPSKQHKSIFD